MDAETREMFRLMFQGIVSRGRCGKTLEGERLKAGAMYLDTSLCYEGWPCKRHDPHDYETLRELGAIEEK